MSAWFRAWAVVLVLLVPVTASANWLRRRAPAVAVYYYPVPMSLVPVYRPVYYYPLILTPAPVVATVPVTAAPARLYAVPQPAPPSGTPETTPSTREPPRVTETHSSSRSPTITRDGPTGGGKDVCRVAFWNLSSRELVLTINGTSQTLARGRTLTLRMPREFIWKVGGAEVQRERIPTDKSTLDIVIRR